MAGVLIVTVLATVALLGVVLYIIREEAARRREIDQVLHDEGMPTLEYSVPTGQDPAVILAALERAGYIATVDPGITHEVVLVACPDGVARERDRVRALIESASITAPEDGVPQRLEVRFRDEG